MIAQRWHGTLQPSRWRLAVVALGAGALTAALTLICAALWPQWPGVVHLLLGISVAVVLSLPNWRAPAPAIALQTQPDDDGDYGFWMQADGAPARPEPEQALPRLLHYRRYFGLYYLRSTQAELLIWPDSLEAEQHRQLRVWLASIRL